MYLLPHGVRVPEADAERGPDAIRPEVAFLICLVPALAPTTVLAYGAVFSATGVFDAASHRLAAFMGSTHSADAHRWVTYQWQATVPREFCGLCRSVFRPERPEDRRLGLKGYCYPCIADRITRCLDVNHRLPEQQEFYCPHCEEILDKAHLVPKESTTGRQRWVCRPCRSEAVYAKEKLRLAMERMRA